MGGPLEKGEEVEQQLPTIEKSAEEPTVQKDEVLDIVRLIDTEVEPSLIAEIPEETQAESIPMEIATVNEHIEEVEEPLLTHEEAAANLATRNSEAIEMDMEVDENRTAGWNSTERIEKNTDETLERREVVIVTDEEEETEQVPHSDEAAEAKAAAILTYQRMLAREETSRRRSEEELSREAPRQRAGGNVNSPARSAVEIPRCRRRLLIDEEHEEKEDVIFTPIDAQPSFGQPNPPAEVEDCERERRERQRKGNTIATPLKKKPRQASTTLVIQEGRERVEERDDEEDEALSMERRSKRRNDGVRSASEQRPEMAKI
ncbi:vicilin-like seed storage protein At2g18540 [Salvia splendens]|uniref:vicilin-like seed storage protein At2g18540 n=1 Tax=Salvia splendens TaxID=180675 RepID=UPI001C25CC63|nr:vicilin-like seed storage protein At2g18540 [Salvia splendens]